MIHIHVRNVNEALPVALAHYKQRELEGDLQTVVQRGAIRYEFPGPFATTYIRPRERVLFSPVRDANPFFHLMESLWILAGENSVKWLAQWLPSIKDYSDDGIGFHGGYGLRSSRYRQVQNVIERFQEDMNTTRSVIALYDPSLDSGYVGKDMPCNCTIFMTIRHHRLDISVANRSNDLIWGAYGANVVQFSMLQEYIACQLGVEVGTYTQFSHNTHLYPENSATKRCLDAYTGTYSYDPYTEDDHVVPVRLISPAYRRTWDMTLKQFTSEGRHHLSDADPFFKVVVYPMDYAYRAYQRKDFEHALAIIDNDMTPCDWQKAAHAWMERRAAKA